MAGKEYKDQNKIIELEEKIKNLNILHAKNKILIINALVNEYGAQVYKVLEDGIGLDTIQMFDELGFKTKERTIDDLIKNIVGTTEGRWIRIHYREYTHWYTDEMYQVSIC